jgi:hypothetical protein
LTVGRKGVELEDGWEPARGVTIEPSMYLPTLLESVDRTYPEQGARAELTGGIDTRLIMGARLGRDLPYASWTVGTRGGSEMRTIAALREKVSFEHTLVEVTPSFGADLPELLSRMHELGDGEVNAVEYAPLLLAFDALADLRETSVTGSGGEAARGFYFGVLRHHGRKVRGVPIEALLNKVTRVAGRLHHRMRRDAIPAGASSAIERALERFILESPLEAPEGILEDLYLRGRMQRFAGRNITTTGLFCQQALPYFDNRLIDCVMALPYPDKRDGRVVRRAVQALSPALAEIPLDSGAAVAAAQIGNPAAVARRVAALARKAVKHYGPRFGVSIHSADNIPWREATLNGPFTELCRDLLDSPTSLTDELFTRDQRATVVRLALDGRTSLYPLGLLLTLELTLRRVAAQRRG